MIKFLHTVIWFQVYNNNNNNKLRNIKMTIIPLVIGALGTVIWGLIKGLKDLEIKG